MIIYSCDDILKGEGKMVLEIAKAYQENEEIKAAQDSIYGKGTTEYTGKAPEAFYRI